MEWMSGKCFFNMQQSSGVEANAIIDAFGVRFSASKKKELLYCSSEKKKTTYMKSDSFKSIICGNMLIFLGSIEISIFHFA